MAIFQGRVYVNGTIDMLFRIRVSELVAKGKNVGKGEHDIKY